MNKKAVAGSALFLAIIPILISALIIFMVAGGGIALAFTDIPWYVWAGLLLIFIFWILK